MSQIDLSLALNTATKAALCAADVLQAHFHHREELIIDHKKKNDLVSQADREAEHHILDILKKDTPTYSIVAEETGLAKKNKALATWFIDPLDGTTNFLHGIPHFAISIALVAHKGTVITAGTPPLTEEMPIVAIIYDPNRKELFTAIHQRGCQLNGQIIHCSRTETLEHSLLATGLPFRDFSFEEGYLSMLKKALHHTRGVRRFGAASLDLAWVACGRFDAYWELRLSPWDVAAGTLLVREAGGTAQDLYEQNAWPQHGNIIASNPLLFSEFKHMIQPHLPPMIN